MRVIGKFQIIMKTLLKIAELLNYNSSDHAPLPQDNIKTLPVVPISRDHQVFASAVRAPAGLRSFKAVATLARFMVTSSGTPNGAYDNKKRSSSWKYRSEL